MLLEEACSAFADNKKWEFSLGKGVWRILKKKRKGVK